MPVIRTCTPCQQKNRVSARHLSASGRCGACKAELPPLAEPLPVDSALFDEIIENAAVPVLVDVWADRCGPYRTPAPEVSRTAADMAGKAIVLKLDTEANPQLSARFQVRGIPNFVVISGGRTSSGRQDWSVIRKWRSGFDQCQFRTLPRVLRNQLSSS